MSSQDIKATVERLTASGQGYVIATVVRTEAPSSAKAGESSIEVHTGSPHGPPEHHGSAAFP